ncbi:MAG: tetratricopeptide repeat protein [Gammaproteobacteria bacterium]|nr:tetratricopeptide repeat protein [Gammaproteobacteria bacterium]
MDLFTELKKRNVFRVAAVYAIASWLILQVSDVVIGNVGAPDWVFKIIMMVLGLGLPVVLVFAWAFEMTPEGIKLEKDVDRSQSITPQTGRKLNAITVGLLAVAVVYLLGDKFLVRAPDQAAAVTAVVEQSPPQQASVELTPATQGPVNESIAVLPFVNMSSDPEQEIFSDGITEELLNLLAKIPDFQVAGRTSSFAFKGENKDLRQIGESLNVANVLEGSVRKSGGRVRITAQLIKVANGYHLWSESYDRELTDIFAVQDEIAGAVVKALELTLLGSPGTQEADPLFKNADAHTAYLNGMHLYNTGEPENFLKAIPYFEEAVRLVPNSALAWANLSRNMGWASGTSAFGEAEIREMTLRAREAATRALVLNGSLAEAYIAQGSIQNARDFNWEGAETSYRRALELRPGSVDARFGLGRLLTAAGRFTEGMKFLEEGHRQDPLNNFLTTELIHAKVSAGLLDEAERDVRGHLQTSESSYKRFFLGMILFLRGQYDEALVQMDKESVAYVRLVGRAIVFQKRGMTNEAESAQQQLLAQYGVGAAYQQGEIFSQWGELDTAADWLWRAYETQDPGIQYLNSDVLLKPMKGHPRFEELRKKLNFE